MAKVGIESFLLDCHTNDNMAEIEAAYGIKGFAVIVKLWQKIYSDKGYYCEWIERSPLLFLSQWFGGNSGVDLNLINQVVNHAIKIGIFNESMFSKYAILTSERIQRQYFDVVKRRTEIEVIDEYLLVSVANFKGNVNIIGKNVCRNKENVCKNSTSKVKESKGNNNTPPIIPKRGEAREPIINISDIKDLLLKDELWKENACRQSGLSTEFFLMIPRQIDNFLSWIRSTGAESTVLTLPDAKRRFIYWWKYTGLKEWKDEKERISGKTNRTGDSRSASDGAKPDYNEVF